MFCPLGMSDHDQTIRPNAYVYHFLKQQVLPHKGHDAKSRKRGNKEAGLAYYQ